MESAIATVDGPRPEAREGWGMLPEGWRFHPELVAPDYRDVPEVPFGEGTSSVYRARTKRDRSRPGHIGHPAVASAGRGEALFRAFAHGVGRLLRRLVDWSGEPWDL